MESITAIQGETTYLLYNLTIERALELKSGKLFHIPSKHQQNMYVWFRFSDSQKLAEYFTSCLANGSNICIQENGDNSSSVAPTENRQFREKFAFLCGPPNIIYAIKFGTYEWHYFDVPDSIITQHSSLPASMNSLIRGLVKAKTINVNLNEDQTKNYFHNCKFVFKNKQLKTCVFFSVEFLL